MSVLLKQQIEELKDASIILAFEAIQDMLVLLNKKVVKLESENKFLHQRIDRIAKNYRILDNTDNLVVKKQLHSQLSGIRKRIYTIEKTLK